MQPGLKELEPGDTVQVNEGTRPHAIAGQVCTVVKKVPHFAGEAYEITVSHPHHNELVYLRHELTLLGKGESDA